MESSGNGPTHGPTSSRNEPIVNYFEENFIRNHTQSYHHSPPQPSQKNLRVSSNPFSALIKQVQAGAPHSFKETKTEEKREQSTKLKYGSQVINQNTLLHEISQPGAAALDVNRLFIFWNRRRRGASQKVTLTEKQLDILYAVAGCSDVSYCITNIKPELRKALDDFYGISRVGLSTFFKNRAHGSSSSTISRRATHNHSVFEENNSEGGGAAGRNDCLGPKADQLGKSTQSRRWTFDGHGNQQPPNTGSPLISNVKWGTIKQLPLHHQQLEAQNEGENGQYSDPTQLPLEMYARDQQVGINQIIQQDSMGSGKHGRQDCLQRKHEKWSPRMEVDRSTESNCYVSVWQAAAAQMGGKVPCPNMADEEMSLDAPYFSSSSFVVPLTAADLACLSIPVISSRPSALMDQGAFLNHLNSGPDLGDDMKSLQLSSDQDFVVKCMAPSTGLPLAGGLGCDGDRQQFSEENPKPDYFMHDSSSLSSSCLDYVVPLNQADMDICFSGSTHIAALEQELHIFHQRQQLSLQQQTTKTDG